MSSYSERAHRFASFVLVDPRAIGLLVVAYIGLGLVFVRTDYTLHDEGLLTHYWASWARQDLVPVFFHQKVKPVLTLIYSPFTAFGVHATLYAHVVVAALSMPMLASTARSLGHRLPNLPAMVLMFSPIYFFGGASGLSNIDGVVGVTLVLYLLAARRWPLAAGLVAGALPWVRFELAVFALFVGLYALRSQRDRSALLGVAIFPVLYTIAGAVYHRDPLWLVHYPPSAPFDPTNPVYREQLIGLQYLLEPALAVTPVAALAAALHARRLDALERMALVYAAAAIFAVHVLPMFGIGNFGASPRYSVHVLPALALLLGRAIEPWWDGERLDNRRVLAILLLAMWISTRQIDARIIVPIVLAYVAVVAAARYGYGRSAVALAVLLVVAGPLMPLRFEVGRALTAPFMDPILDWLESHPAEANAPIYTNCQLLAPMLEARGREPGSVFYLAGVDSTREKMLVNEKNGQLARLRRLAESDLYGRAVTEQVSPADLPPGSLIVVRVETRLPLLLPDDVWGPRLQVLDQSPTYRIARFQ